MLLTFLFIINVVCCLWRALSWLCLREDAKKSNRTLAFFCHSTFGSRLSLFQRSSTIPSVSLRTAREINWFQNYYLSSLPSISYCHCAFVSRWVWNYCLRGLFCCAFCIGLFCRELMACRINVFLAPVPRWKLDRSFADRSRRFHLGHGDVFWILFRVEKQSFRGCGEGRIQFMDWDGLFVCKLVVNVFVSDHRFEL